MDTFAEKPNDGSQNRPAQIQNVGVNPMALSVLTSPVESSSIGELAIVQNQEQIWVRRLVVLIPNLDVNESEIARVIWDLAFPARLAILFLGLCRDEDEEPYARRQLATIAALTRDPRISVEVQLEFGHNWISALNAVWEPGDIVVCHAEQQAGPWHQPLEFVLTRLKIPNLTLKGLIQPISKSPSTFLHEIIFWMVSGCIVIGFFWLQAQTLRISEIWARDTVLSFSVLIELGLIWIWDILSH